MAYPDLATINKNIYSNSTPLKKYSKELQRRQNLANWGQLRDAYQAADWTKQYDTQQMQQNAYSNAYNTGNTRGSYVNQALVSGAAPIEHNYDQAMKGVGNQETALNDAAWAKAHAPKAPKKKAPVKPVAPVYSNYVTPTSNSLDQMAGVTAFQNAAQQYGKDIDNYNAQVAQYHR